MDRRRSISYARLACAAALFAISASGCASCAEAAERDRIRDDRVAAHVYATECPMVLAAAREVLFDRGFSISMSDQSAFTLETEWRPGGARTEVERSRYLVRGAEEVVGTCAITARLQEQTFDDFDDEEVLESRRDLDLEWSLLRIADPAAAAEIQEELDAV